MINYQYIQYQIADRICSITLNRPEKRNAFNEDLVAELLQAFNIAEDDEQVKVVILKANGEVFSAGADLAYLQKLQDFTYEENLADSLHLKELFEKIYTFKKITIAQVEGHAIAGGCGLATVCDFCFAVSNAKFGYTEVKIGFVPALVMVYLLKKVGEQKTKELLLTGDLFTAEQAKTLGIIYQVIEKNNIQMQVNAFAQKLCIETSAQSIAVTKMMITKIQNMSYEDAFHFAAEMNAQGRSSVDCIKGISSFLNKEKLIW